MVWINTGLNSYKNLAICITALLLISLGSCKKEPVEHQVGKETKVKKHPKTKKILIDAEHRGIYVNDFEAAILGDLSEEDYLLDWCQYHEFTNITLYNISSILNDAGQTDLLKEFVFRARNDYDLEVTFVAVSKSALQKIKLYCQSNSFMVHPDGVATEYEFWNSPYNYSYYKQMLKKIDDMNQYFGPWENHLYLFKFHDAGGVYADEQVLSKTVQHIKVIGTEDADVFFTYYKPNAEFFPPTSSTYYKRLAKLAKKARHKNVVLNVVVLYNVNYESGSANLFEYFDEDDATDDGVVGEDHEFEEAFINFKDGFDASSIEYKDHINLKGYQIYRYTQAREARGM